MPVKLIFPLVFNVVAEENKTLSELAKDLVIYPQVLKNVGVSNKDAIMAHEGLLEKIKEIGYGFRVVGAGTSSHDYGIFVSPVL